MAANDICTRVKCARCSRTEAYGASYSAVGRLLHQCPQLGLCASRQRRVSFAAAVANEDGGSTIVALRVIGGRAFDASPHGFSS